MTDTLIKVDLNQPATENEQIHNRWHPDIPMACWVKPESKKASRPIMAARTTSTSSASIKSAPAKGRKPMGMGCILQKMKGWRRAIGMH